MLVTLQRRGNIVRGYLFFTCSAALTRACDREAICRKPRRHVSRPPLYFTDRTLTGKSAKRFFRLEGPTNTTQLTDMGRVVSTARRMQIPRQLYFTDRSLTGKQNILLKGQNEQVACSRGWVHFASVRTEHYDIRPTGIA